MTHITPYITTFLVGLVAGIVLSFLFARRAIADYKAAYTLLEAKFQAFRHSTKAKVDDVKTGIEKEL